MDSAGVLAAFDAEVRRSVLPDGSGARIEAEPPVVRWVCGHDRAAVTMLMAGHVVG
jgi:hypothetical protein